MLLVMVVLVGVVSGQKGGAKGAMRGNRGKVRSVLIPGGKSQNISIYQNKGVICDLTTYRVAEAEVEGAGVAGGSRWVLVRFPDWKVGRGT